MEGKNVTGGNRNVVIVMEKYSVVVKSIERSLRDLGCDVTILAEGFDKVHDYARDESTLFILYVPGGVLDDNSVLTQTFRAFNTIQETGRTMLVIGERKDYDGLTEILPDLRQVAWIDRPVKMDLLEAAVNKGVVTPGVQSVKKRILIVDDDPAYAKMVREWLKDTYQVNIVTAGIQAITYVLKNPVDLILLDYDMPVVNGRQVLEMLRQEPTTQGITVIFLTGVGSRKEVERVMALKPDGYILKTITREQLLAVLQEKL